MIIDSHCHAWTYWPYEPPVPDPEQRGRVEQLLNEMDLNGVDRSVVVCAEIDHNPENNAFIADAVRRDRSRPHQFSDMNDAPLQLLDAVQRQQRRLYQFADVDCCWKPSYHTPGAADRLRRAADAWPISGFTHYVAGEDSGEWFGSDEGLAFFQAASDLKLIASISCAPHHQPAIRRVAERFPSMPVLIHHLGAVKANEPPPHEGLREVLASAKLPNIYVKMSGFYYASQVKWDFPYSEAGWIVRAEYEAFGPHRMCWGSDYPVVRFFMTYRQSIECFRSYCHFIPETDKALILGGTLERLLGAARAG